MLTGTVDWGSSPPATTCCVWDGWLLALIASLSVLTNNRTPLLRTALQVFAGLLVGAMLPYWFSAMTMKSVGKAALAMVEEVRRQFNTIAGELSRGGREPTWTGTTTALVWLTGFSNTQAMLCGLHIHDYHHRYCPPAGLMEGTGRPDYKACVAISTSSSLSEMIPPGLLVMLTPVVVGSLFGTKVGGGAIDLMSVGTCRQPAAALGGGP